MHFVFGINYTWEEEGADPTDVAQTESGPPKIMAIIKAINWIHRY